MGLATTTVNLVSGGAQSGASGAVLVKTILSLGMSTSGPVNVLQHPSTSGGARSGLGAGPLAEAAALQFQVQGSNPFFMPLNPSTAGGVSSVTHVGVGSGDFAVAPAPHVPFKIKCSTGGTLGNAAFQFSFDGGVTYGAPVASTSPFVYQVPGTFVSLSFGAATYVATKTWAIDVANNITTSSGWVGTITPTASPIDAYDLVATVLNPGPLGTCTLAVSLDGGRTQYGPAYLVPTVGVCAPLNTGLVFTLGQDQITFTIDPTTGGALGTMVMSYSVNGGGGVSVSSTTANVGNNFVITVSGVTFTFVPGTYVTSSTYIFSTTNAKTGTGLLAVTSTPVQFLAGETYSCVSFPPGPTTSDIQAAIVAASNDPSAPRACTIDIGPLPSSASSAFTLAQAIESSLVTAFANGLDWRAVMTIPTVGDIINLSGTVELDTADTRTVIKGARLGVTCTRVSIFEGTDNVQSAVGSYQVRRPRSTTFAQRIATKLPGEKNHTTVASRDASLNVAQIGDDELAASVSLYDAQVNSFQRVPTYNGAYLSIGSGLYGWQYLNLDIYGINADGMRAIDAVLAGFRPVCAALIGNAYPVNSDGTIESKTANELDTLLNNAIQLKAGFGIGADFNGVPQLSSVSAYVDRSTNLGPTGSKIIKIDVLPVMLGFTSGVAVSLYFAGV